MYTKTKYPTTLISKERTEWESGKMDLDAYDKKEMLKKLI